MSTATEALHIPAEVVYLKPAQVASILDVTENTLAIWRTHHCGPAFLKAGHSIRYPVDPLSEWIRSVTHECRPEVSGLRPAHGRSR